MRKRKRAARQCWECFTFGECKQIADGKAQNCKKFKHSQSVFLLSMNRRYWFNTLLPKVRKKRRT